MSLFSGTPITATTSQQQTTQTPQWLQDAIYNQIQTVQNVAAIPFQQYTGQQVAGPTQNQQSAWSQTAQNAGSWQPLANLATQGLSGLASQPNPYAAAQGQVTNALQNAGAGQAAASPYLNAATQGGGLSAAQPYLNAASQSAAGGIGAFMNPYTQNVTDRIAQLGARNLSENLLPSIGDQFIQAGQFGGSRMGEFASRALRDTQDSVLGQQASALQSGYNTALGASQSELARQLQLGQTAGGFADQQSQTQLNAGQLAGNLANQQFGNQLSGAQALGNMAQQNVSSQTGLYGSLLDSARQQQQLGQSDAQSLAAAGGDERAIQQQQLQSMYDQYLRSQQYPQQQTNYLTQQLGALSGLAPSVQSTTGVSPVGVSPSTGSQVIGGLTGLAGLLS